MIEPSDSEDIEVSMEQSTSFIHSEPDDDPNQIDIEQDLPPVFPLIPSSSNPHAGILPKGSVSPRAKYTGTFLFMAGVLALSIGLSTMNASNQKENSMTGPAVVSRLSYFGESSLKTYDTCDDFVLDLEEAAALLASATIERNAHFRFHPYWECNVVRGASSSAPCYYVSGVQDDVVFTNDDGIILDSPPVMANPPVSDTAVFDKESVSSSSSGENSFGTNNQVAGVDEADLVKSDGEHVFAAYGNTLVVWDALTGVELSRTEMPLEDEDGVGICPEDVDQSMVCYWQGGGWYFAPMISGSSSSRISSILIHENRLVVTASNMNVLNGSSKILNGYRQTRMFLYDISIIPTDGSELTLIARKDLQGELKTGRSIGQYGHFVTASYVNTWDELDYPLSPWHPDFNDAFGDDMTETEYLTKAYEIASEIVPEFAQKLAGEVMRDGRCSHIAKISLMLQPSGTGTEAKSLPLFTQNSVLSTLTQVYSTDLSEDFPTLVKDVVPKAFVSSSDVFLPVPSYTNNIYSSETRMVVAGESYTENEIGEWKEQTVFLAFELDGASSSFHSFGSVKGSLLNQFSMDHYVDLNTNEDYLRVATTTWARWGLVGSDWQAIEESESVVSILKMPDDSSTSSMMEIVGEVDNIGTGERLFACRFLGERGYVVTFRQVDPFYTLDLSNVTNPFIAGELKIPGFSNYLHPVNEGLILAIGQDATEEGIQTGLQIAMFDVSDIENPIQTHKYVESSWSSSEAQDEHKAFRYLSESKKLIIPLYRYEPYFDGFAVYDVDESKEFSKLFEISHALGETDANQSFFCWGQETLPTRSLVFNGNVTTLKGHTVLSTNLESAEILWTFNLDDGLNNMTDYCWGWRGEPQILIDPPIDFIAYSGEDLGA